LPDYYCLLGPLVRLIEPETGHALALGALKRNLVPRPHPFEDPVLGISLWGREFANPVGLAAGFDKNAEVTDAMLAQGFGFVEVGSVTPRPQPGKPRPRLYRLPADGAVINRMGFNNQGQDVMARRLEARGNGGIVGVNLGKNLDTEDAASDYVRGVEALAGLADYLVINVSSPNMPGLRALQGREPLAALIGAVKEAMPEQPPPLLLKIAPDLTDEDKRDIAEVALETAIDGIIATNTTVERPPGLTDRHRTEGGGLSGRPLRDMATAVLADIHRLTAGKIPLIGVGGIESGADAYARIRAGASLVQLYTALIYRGPGIANRIKRELAHLLRADGFERVADAVGADHR
jgi:dihydroorotate dehydrogenase